MKTIRVLLPVLPLILAFAPSLALGIPHEGCTCGGKGAKLADSTIATMATATGSADAGKTDAPARHPLKGVVVEVMSDRAALLVQHEEVPGVMKAMTMMLKVDEAALASAKKGDSVTGMLVRKTDGWWLEDVKVVGAAN